MTKEEMRERLKKESFDDITKNMNWTSGQCCNIVKQGWPKEITDENRKGIIYIGDMDLTECVLSKPLSSTWYLDDALSYCFTVQDFLDEANGHEKIAEKLYNFVDWQTPNVEDYLNDWDWDRESTVEEFGEDAVKWMEENMGIKFDS